MKYFFCCFIFFICSANSYAQYTDTVLANIITNIRSFHILNPYERTFTSTDKQFYQPGETVWFKTLLTLNEQPSKLSNVIYTDLTNADGKLLLKQMWRAENGICDGSFYLSDSLTTGMYRLRTYSLWMLNEPGSIHEVYFFVLGKNDQAKSFVASGSGTTVEVFPEGGKLIAGLINRVTFTVYYKDGLPVTRLSSVDLSDAAGNKKEVVPFFYRGIGYFEFVPEQNKNYKLTVKDNAGLQKSVDLPLAVTNAISLKLSNLSASKVLIETVVDDLFINNNKSVTVLAQQNGQVVFANRFQLHEDQKAAIIQKKNLSNGLLQVTVFNEQMQPLSERFIIVTKQTDASVSISNILFSPAPKAVNSFDVNFKGIDTPSLTISVIPFDLPLPPFVISNSIHSSTINTFSQQNKKHLSPSWNDVADSLKNAFADAILLTTEPQRASWQQMISGAQTPLKYFFETGISVRGFVKKNKETMLFDSSKVELITKGEDSTTILSYAKPDDRGAFAVNDLDFYKSASVYVQATVKDKKRRKIEFDIVPSYIDTLSTVSSPVQLNAVLKQDDKPKSDQENFVKNYSKVNIGKELSEIVIKGNKSIQKKSDSVNNKYGSEISRTADFVLEVNNEFGYASIWQILQENVPGLYVSSATSSTPMVYFNRTSFAKERTAGDVTASEPGGNINDAVGGPVTDITFLLNEIPIAPFEVSMINPNDIAVIKVYRNQINSFTVSTGEGLNGTILIYTKKNLARSNFGMVTVTGYNFPYKFSNPDYSKPELQKTEDRRTTLLWQPTIKFDNNGNAKIQFYNNDYTKKFKVVIQGMDKNGNPYYLEKIIE